MHITHQPIPIETFLKERPEASCGASVDFVGTVRNRQGGRLVRKLYYECYEPMAERQIASIVDEVRREHEVDRIRVAHRVGWLEVGEVAVAISVHAAHRDEAFLACKAVIDRVKAEVPIWKKEIYADGDGEWVLCAHSAEAAP